MTAPKDQRALRSRLWFGRGPRQDTSCEEDPDRQCAVRGVGDDVSFRTTTAGIYRIAVRGGRPSCAWRSSMAVRSTPPTC